MSHTTSVTHALRSFDAILTSTAHACVNHVELAAWAPPIIDTGDAMALTSTKPGQA